MLKVTHLLSLSMKNISSSWLWWQDGFCLLSSPGSSLLYLFSGGETSGLQQVSPAAGTDAGCGLTLFYWSMPDHRLDGSTCCSKNCGGGNPALWLWYWAPLGCRNPKQRVSSEFRVMRCDIFCLRTLRPAGWIIFKPSKNTNLISFLLLNRTEA